MTDEEFKKAEIIKVEITSLLEAATSTKKIIDSLKGGARCEFQMQIYIKQDDFSGSIENSDFSLTMVLLKDYNNLIKSRLKDLKTEFDKL